TVSSCGVGYVAILVLHFCWYAFCIHCVYYLRSHGSLRFGIRAGGVSFPAKSQNMTAAVPHQSLARPYRKSLLVALLIITFLSGLLFAWINIVRANYPVAVVELLMAGYSMILLLALRH